MSEKLSHKKRLPLLPKNEPSRSARLTIAVPNRLVATEVFDTYWRFAAERQAIFFRRAERLCPPWTADPILQRYRFTNAYRAADRVSQFLIANVQYGSEQDPATLFFRTILFKLFNKIDTWHCIERAAGPITPLRYDKDAYVRVLSTAMDEGKRIYSAAYIMPSGGKSFAHLRKHQAHLALLQTMMRDGVPITISECKSMTDAYATLRRYPMIGNFLAYQYVIDLNYSNLTNFSEMEFVVPGPGALSGIRKCFSDIGSYSEADVIRWVTDRQEDEFRRLGLHFQSLWGRCLQLVDCQNLFCEVDKYSRVYHPAVRGISNRVRIKREFRQDLTPLKYWLPPKWGLNDTIEGWRNKTFSTSAFSAVGETALHGVSYRQ